MLRPSAKSSSVTTVQQARERPEVSGPDEPLGVRVGVGRASDEEKVRYVRRMFGAIAPRYDLTNTVISLGLHRWWKRLAAVPPGGRAADVCCGTGDLALLMARRAGPRGRVLGVDFSEEMLAVARHRAARAGVGDVCRFVLGDALALAVPDGALDAVTVGFGIRNVLRPDGALRELHRVLRPGGRAVILEFSRPQSPVVRKLYDLYSFTLMPWLGRVASRHEDAYLYLPTSIRSWPDQASFARQMEAAGFTGVRYVNLWTGIAAIHIGIRSGGGAARPRGEP